MPGTDDRAPQQEEQGVSRRRLLLSAAALGALIPATAEVVAWLRHDAASAHPPTGQHPIEAPRVSAPPPTTAPVAPANAPAARGRLAGKTIVIDPGHNSHNPQHVAQINTLVNAGGFLKSCDTVGAETDAGYPEFDFTLDVARRARSILRSQGG